MFGEYLTLFGPSALVSAATIIAAVIATRTQAKTPYLEGSVAFDRVVRIASIVSAGGIIALLAMTVPIGITQVSLDERVGVGDTIAKFSETPTAIGRAIYVADKDAAAILAGAGPKEWSTRTEKYETGDIRFADKWEWVDIVIPNANSTRVNSDICGLDVLGELTIVGFSVTRRAALMRYKAPDSAAGTHCDTDTYFFYPLPPSR